MVSSNISQYITLYDQIEEEEDLETLKNMAKFLLVGRALNDPTLPQEHALALAEYATIKLDTEEEGVTIH